MIEIKSNSGHIIECKQVERNGIPVGIVKGYIATWDIDRVKDKFMPGAFSEHIDEYRKNGRQIKVKNQHGNTVGGFPIESIKEDGKGLYGEGEINLEVQEGRETYSLAKQGVLTDLSIGYAVIEKEFIDGIRHIRKSKVFEGSLVDDPANMEARITEVKAYPNEHAARVKNPDLFEPDSFRRKPIGDSGVIAILGKLKGSDSMTVQAYRFPKDKFTSSQAEAWLKDNDVKPIEFEAAEPEKQYSITDLKNIGKSDLVKIFRSANLSRDAANHVASIVITDSRLNDSGNPVKMLGNLRDQIKTIQEMIKHG